MCIRDSRHAMPHILIVEDEAAIADTLLYALQAEGFATTWVTLAGEALALQERQPADLLILDVGLPDISGFEACKRLRRFSEVPVIFLTARDAEIDRVVGLEIGADDYVVKPFSPREVAARVKAILKRMAPRPAALEGAAPRDVYKRQVQQWLGHRLGDHREQRQRDHGHARGGRRVAQSHLQQQRGEEGQGAAAQAGEQVAEDADGEGPRLEQARREQRLVDA